MNQIAPSYARWLAVVAVGASMLSAWPAWAQPNLEGTWCGIFTARHHELWRIEDWLCFNG